MYTQCPECSVSFRVTAKVLKQAAGKVRCGGCGIAFNALDYLSEDKPQTDAQTDTDSKLPELTPEFSGDSTDQQRPKAISAEQSAALLKTLDQLAGEEIRIEDTGVEWRVLNVEELDEAEDDMADEQTSVADTGSLNFVLQDVEANGGDEVLEIVDEHEEAEPDSSQQAVAPEEMRFDDNTPLPDDFDLYRKPAVAPAPPPEIVDVTEPLEDYADANAELALGEPDEWEDLLGEVAEEQVAEASGAREEVEPGAGPVIEEQVETRPRAETEAETESESAADEPLDMDTQFALQAEAMGIDLSGIHHSSEAAETEATAIQDTDVDTSIDEDLIAAAFEA
ncbi:MAG: zinc-ribbon domain-containing protein, partial [Gammaproteobacteria bacterium]|nr:zinc-ribbon domain-containing protein [Gammaproteobacteria bacterium]